MMRYLFVVVLVSFLIPIGVLHADDARRLALARELIQITAGPGIVHQIRQEFYQQDPRFKHFTKSFDKFIREQTPIIVEACAQGYARELTEAELKELLQLVKKPTMLKYLKIETKVKTYAMSVWEKHLQQNPNLIHDLVKSMEQEQKEKSPTTKSTRIKK